MRRRRERDKRVPRKCNGQEGAAPYVLGWGSLRMYSALIPLLRKNPERKHETIGGEDDSGHYFQQISCVAIKNLPAIHCYDDVAYPIFLCGTN